MKKKILGSLLICGTIFTAQAQFSTIYNHMGPEADLRGFDVEVNNGEYYYSCGNEDKKIVFIIDPTNGTIKDDVNANYESTLLKSSNGVGKNKMAIWSPEGSGPPPHLALPNMILNSGLDDSRLNSISILGGTAPPSISLFSLRSSNYNFNNYYSYSDQVSVDDNGNGVHEGHFMTGTRLEYDGNYYTTPFSFKTHAGNPSAIHQYSYIKPIYFTSNDPDYDEVSTKIIESNEKTYITYGSLTHDGNSYVNNNNRNPGIWATDNNNVAVFNNTYHLWNGESMGMAQSAVIVDTYWGDDYPVMVSSGGYNKSDYFMSSGGWSQYDYKNFFHILKIHPTTGAVMISRKISLSIPNNPDDIIGYRVNVGDIVQKSGQGNGNKLFVTGSITIAREVIDHVNQIMWVEEVAEVFIIELDQGFDVIQAKRYQLDNFKNGEWEAQIQANRIKVIGSELFVCGSIETTSRYNRTPFLIKVNESDLQLDCSEDLVIQVEQTNIFTKTREVVNETANLYEYAPPEKERENIESQSQCYSGPMPEEGMSGERSYLTSSKNLSEVTMVDKYTVSPNPSSSKISINGILDGEATIKITDVNGRLVFDYNGSVNANHSLNISEFETGMYIMNITQNNQVSTLRFVKE